MIPTDTQCQRMPRLFDSRDEGEPHKAAAARQRLAIHACRSCPALGACKRYLLDCESRGAQVDGVVAGRHWRRLRDRVAEVRPCADCGADMVKRGTPTIDRLRTDGTLTARHAGRGLCDDCYSNHRIADTLSRFPRQSRTSAHEKGGARR
ncbi:hypothetical protein FOB82_03045 [Corynebacterium xerosis]|uniref:4Fe-4S Wbl-type domain-containing protein n=1 Tax=Corynebacterium xerosis TaxID=1725 RepID=A0A6B8TSC6_9CORY|nr:hypothetical protein [Corynebacterium xerosis]QGS34073.1 hypothetical protein FOB82_03045 [Corynebacterium xerosis]